MGKCSKTNAQKTIDELDALSRTRQLSLAESIKLERAINIVEHKRGAR